MDAAKLANLREKYSNEKAVELENQFDDRVPYVGVSSFLDMPHQLER